jgi:hypothetical protein
MLGKNENHNIFNQYRSILLEQVEEKSFESFIKRIQAASFDPRLKSEILELLKNPMVENAYGVLNRVGDADTAGYASYPEATPAQDDQESANEPDPDFGKELARERERQQKENPERLPEEDYEASFFQGDKLDFDKLTMKFPEKQATVQSSAPRPKDPSIYRKESGYVPSSENPNTKSGFFGGEKSRISGSGGNGSGSKDENWARKSSQAMREFARGASSVKG